MISKSKKDGKKDKEEKEKDVQSDKPVRRKAASLGRKTGKSVEKAASNDEETPEKSDKPSLKKRSLSLIRRPKKMKPAATNLFEESSSPSPKDKKSKSKEKEKEKDKEKEKAKKEKEKEKEKDKAKRKGAGEGFLSPKKRGRSQTTPNKAQSARETFVDLDSDSDSESSDHRDGMANGNKASQNDPKTFHTRLSSRGPQPQDLLNTLTELSLYMREKSTPQWIQTFVVEPLRGVSLLIELLVEKQHKQNKSGTERSIMATALECLRYLLNTQVRHYDSFFDFFFSTIMLIFYIGWDSRSAESNQRYEKHRVPFRYQRSENRCFGIGTLAGHLFGSA